MPIELVVHAPDFDKAYDYAEVTQYLRALPGAHEEGYDFTFRDEEAGIFIVATPGHGSNGDAGITPGPDDTGQCNGMRLRVPNDLTPTTREPLAEFAFSIARRFGWQVYDSATQAHYADEAELVRHLGGVLAPASASGCATMLALCLALIGFLLLLAR
jgi:hypothetical protein